MEHIITATHTVSENTGVHYIAFHDSKLNETLQFPIRAISSMDDFIGLAQFYLDINKINASLIEADVSGVLGFRVYDEN